MEQLLEILNDINPDVDYETEDNTMIGEICDTFGIEIGPQWMRNENFNSAQKIWEMIQKIQEEE